MPEWPNKVDEFRALIDAAPEATALASVGHDAKLAKYRGDITAGDYDRLVRRAAERLAELQRAESGDGGRDA